MNIQPKISIIFVNYRSARYLERALESLFLFEKKTDSFEIIVVNNDISEKKTLSEMKQKFPFLLIQNSTNVGFGAGNNRGAKQARGSILGFINPDILWTKEQLHKVSNFFDEKSDLGILGMTIFDEQKRKEDWSTGKEPSLKTLFQNNIFPIKQGRQEDWGISFPDWVSGGALFIQKNIFSQLAGFDEQFFLYFEDVDLCKRVRSLGLSVLRDKEYSLVHFGGKSRHSNELQKKQFYISQKKYFKKHRPVWENKILHILHLLFHNNKV